MAVFNGAHTGSQIDSAVDAVELAKSAGSTDSTAGRLLKVGDFGLGASNTNANQPDSNDDEIFANGFYRTTSANSGDNPFNNIGQILHMEQQGGFACQLAIKTNDGNEAKIRHKDTGIWSEWADLATSDNSSLIESGSNANGSYTKYPDGTLICWMQDTATTSFTITTTSAGQYFSNTSTLVFPSPFIGSPSVQNSSWCPSVLINTEVGNISAGSCILRMQSAISQTVNINIGYIAIGRWK